MLSNMEKHKKHLAEVSQDIVKRKMEFFKLKNIELKALPIICTSFVVKPPFKEYKEWLHPLEPVSLDDLKNWVGVPNLAAKNLLKERRVICSEGKLWAGASQITPRALPSKENWDFKKLDNEERVAVQQMSKSLLYGYVEPESQKAPSVKGVVKYMLEAAKNRLKIFMAKDLVICPDEVVEFQSVPALYFNNILIYGNGKLKTNGKTTIHAVQIKRVP